MSLPAGTHVSELALTVRRLGTSLDFYRGTLGLEILEEGSGGARLGAPGHAFLRLVEDPAAEVPLGRARLYHFAILFPSRVELALAARRLLERRWSLGGAADHLVSEALYLSDPEGNGIELYRDRPREEWDVQGGRVRMDTLPLDLEALLSEAAASPEGAVSAPTRLGHIHLHVRDLAEAERFYREVVGLDVMERFGGSASFLAAGGYHHHLGINTWGTAGALRALEGAQGLRWYRLSLPDGEALAELVARLRAAEVPFATQDGEVSFKDPSGHRLLVQAG